MNRISAVVSVFNEEESLEKCLNSLKFADEIVVVDNGSSDKSLEIAKKFTNKIYTQQNNPGLIDIQKNFGFEKATGEWILSIDADEEVTKELSREIKKVLGKSVPKNLNGYWIPRKNIIFGKWIENAGWYPDFQLRLFRKGSGKFTKKHVHEPISLKGESGKLKEHIVHYNYSSVSQFVLKTLSYAGNEAEDLLERNYKFSYFDAIKFPTQEFLSRFFSRKGYKDGFHGLMASILMAFYHFLVFAFIWEKKGFSQYNNSDFLKETEKEFRKAGRDILYWLSKEKIESIKSPLRKTAVRITEKLRSL